MAASTAFRKFVDVVVVRISAWAAWIARRAAAASSAPDAAARPAPGAYALLAGVDHWND